MPPIHVLQPAVLVGMRSGDCRIMVTHMYIRSGNTDPAENNCKNR